jgi:GNAT superfamily N-acetyltransferase
MERISFDVINDIDFNYLSHLIEQNSLYEKSFEHSHFFSLISTLKKEYPLHPMSPFIKDLFCVKKISVVIVRYDSDIVGISVFEHYHGSAKTKVNENFTFNKKKYQYETLGFFGFYVKPEWRGHGLATSMIKHFEPMLASTLSFKDNVIYIIASRGDSTPILNKHLKIFTVSRSDGNSSVWRDDAKNYVKYNSLLTRKENIQHLEGIENGKSDSVYRINQKR